MMSMALVEDDVGTHEHERTSTVTITRWSGCTDKYKIHSYAVRTPCLVLDRPDGWTTLIPWKQIVSADIAPD